MWHGNADLQKWTDVTEKSKQKANSSNKPATSLATEHSSKMPASTHVKRKPFSPMSNVENTLYNSRSTFGGVAMGDAHSDATRLWFRANALQAYGAFARLYRR